MLIGMLVFSYGLTELEPYRANAKLAQEAMRILAAEDDEVRLAAQWEVALGIDFCDYVIGPYMDRYLSSAGVIREAKARLFGPLGIKEIIPVAQTFLHYQAVCRQLELTGFTVVKRKIARIGHTPTSLQSHTRGPLRLAAYEARQALNGHEGTPIVTDQMRRLMRDGFYAEQALANRILHP